MGLEGLLPGVGGDGVGGEFVGPGCGGEVVEDGGYVDVCEAGGAGAWGEFWEVEGEVGGIAREEALEGGLFSDGGAGVCALDDVLAGSVGFELVDSAGAEVPGGAANVGDCVGDFLVRHCCCLCLGYLGFEV